MSPDRPSSQAIAELEREWGIFDARERFVDHRKQILQSVSEGRADDLARYLEDRKVPADEGDKEIRFALAGYFLRHFWNARWSRIAGDLRQLRAARPHGHHATRELLVEMFLTEGLDREDRIPSGLLRRLAAALDRLANPRDLESIADVRELIECHALLVVGTAVVEAVSWEVDLDFDDRLVSEHERELWAAYKRALSSVGTYASPSDHIRAGVEGYMLLAGEILFEAPRLHSSWGSSSGFGAAALEEVTDGPALRLIRALAFRHMHAFVAMDHVLRTNRAGKLLFDATQKSGSIPTLGIPSTTLDQIAAVAPHYVDLNNVRPRNRIGCPFLEVPGNLLAELHGDAFMPLVREGLIPRMPEILGVLTRFSIGE